MIAFSHFIHAVIFISLAQVQEYVDAVGQPDTILWVFGFNDVGETHRRIAKALSWAESLGKRCIFAIPVDNQGNIAPEVRLPYIICIRILVPYLKLFRAGLRIDPRRRPWYVPGALA